MKDKHPLLEEYFKELNKILWKYVSEEDKAKCIAEIKKALEEQEEKDDG